jgi:hypothetical protein
MRSRQNWIREKLDRIDELFPAARLAASRERWTRLWRGEPPLDRQPFAFYPFTLDYYDDVLPPEPRLRAILDEIIFRGRLDDDFIPAFFPGCRTSTIPNMFGAAEVVCGRDYSSAKLLQRIEDIAALPVPSLAPGTVAHEWLEMARYVRDETEGRLPIHVADMQGPSDVCGKLWGYEDFLACAYEDPDAFRSLIGKVADAFILLWERQRELAGDLFVGTHLFGWSWVPPGTGASLSSDSFVMISGEFYREFFQPCFEAMAARLGGLTVHSCGDFSAVIPALSRTPGVKAINAGQMSVEAVLKAGVDPKTLLLVIVPAAEAADTFSLIRRHGLRVDLTLNLSVSGVPPRDWGDKEWDLARRENQRILELAAKGVNDES